MATTTAPLVAQKAETAEWHFVSHRRQFLVFLNPSRYIHHPDGSRETVQGDTVQFENSEFRTKDPELAERLRKHPAMAEGDYREIPVVVPPPPADSEIARVMQLVADRDGQTLFDMYVEEDTNWSRPALLDAISKALVALEAQGVEVEEVPVRPNGSAVEATGVADPAPEPGVRFGPPAPDPDVPVEPTSADAAAATTRAFHGS